VGKQRLKTTPNQVRGSENRAKALELRKSGASYRQIGEALGVTMQRAHQLVMDELDRLAQLRLGNADELRRLELERLEMGALAIVTKVKQGNVECVKVWVRISESRRKLLGLDAPIKLEATGPDGGPIELAAVDLRGLSTDELRTLRSLLLKAKGGEGAPTLR